MANGLLYYVYTADIYVNNKKKSTLFLLSIGPSFARQNHRLSKMYVRRKHDNIRTGRGLKEFEQLNLPNWAGSLGLLH